MTSTSRVEDLLRELAPQVLGALVRRHGAFDACEDATQEALIEAAFAWTERGVPTKPRGWLMTVANRRLIDHIRSETARHQREERFVIGAPPAEALLGPGEDVPAGDDSLLLLYLCCHPDLTPPSQIALTLRAVGGLSTSEIARAFLVPETTMAQRISRAKSTLAAADAAFALPDDNDLDARTAAVHQVLYLAFNEGYTATSGGQVSRTDLTNEAIRLTRQLHRLRPHDAETAGLLALMLLTDARRPARLTHDGELVPLAEQDRSRWNHPQIHEGVALVTGALHRGPLGSYQLQAAIAAVHDEAPRAADTDWPQVLALYRTLDRVRPNPMATVNQAVALAMVEGPHTALALLATLAGDRRVADHHLYHAVRGHLLELAERPDEARTAFETAAQRTASAPEKRHLHRRAQKLHTT